MKLKHILVATMVIASVPVVPMSASAVAVTYESPTINKLIKVNLTTIENSSYRLSLKGGYSIKEKPDLFLSDAEYTIKKTSTVVELYKGTTKIYSGSSISLFPVQYDLNHQATFVESSRTYLGNIIFTIDGSKIRVENQLYLEHYLYGVVPYEMSDSWGIQGLEALKAQTVAARSYAIARSNTVLVDTAANQMYKGYSVSNKYSIQAVNETKGVTLQYNGSSIGDNAFYSSSNGGYSLSKVNSWGVYQVPYLVFKADPYDKKVDVHKNWSFSVVKTQINTASLDMKNPSKWWGTTKETEQASPVIAGIKNAIKQKVTVPSGYEIKIKDIPALSFTTPTQSGINSSTIFKGHLEVQYMLYNPSKPTEFTKDASGNLNVAKLTIDERTYNFYLNKYLGVNGIYSMVRSPLVTSVVNDGTKYTVTGSGNGHGIGLSQYGAYQRAKEGQSFRDILGFYYDGVTISAITNEAPAVNPELPTETEDPPVVDNPSEGSEQPSEGEDNSGEEPTIENPNYFTVTNETPVYDNRTGQLVTVGILKVGQEFKIQKDAGANWWQIKFGEISGYIYKGNTKGITAPTYHNGSSGQLEKGKTIELAADAIVYDNTSGALVPFSVLKGGISYPTISLSGNWYVINIGERIGYVHKNSVKVEETKPVDTPPLTGASYFEVVTRTPIYDNRTGKLVTVGYVLEGQQFPVQRDAGANWWQVKFGNISGFIYKGNTKAIAKPIYKNGTSEKSSSKVITVTADVGVYDNSSGSLVPFAVLVKGTVYPVVNQMGSWWKINIGDRIGYVSSSVTK